MYIFYRLIKFFSINTLQGIFDRLCMLQHT